MHATMQVRPRLREKFILENMVGVYRVRLPSVEMHIAPSG